ncbi:unnamed protein product [Rhizopus stolonifer]
MKIDNEESYFDDKSNENVRKKVISDKEEDIETENNSLCDEYKFKNDENDICGEILTEEEVNNNVNTEIVYESDDNVPLYMKTLINKYKESNIIEMNIDKNIEPLIIENIDNQLDELYEESDVDMKEAKDNIKISNKRNKYKKTNKNSELGNVIKKLNKNLSIVKKDTDVVFLLLYRIRLHFVVSETRSSLQRSS